MKQGVLKGMVVVLVVMGLVAVAQPALAWVRVAVNVRVPFPVVVAPVATVVASPVVYAPPAPMYYSLQCIGLSGYPGILTAGASGSPDTGDKGEQEVAVTRPARWLAFGLLFEAGCYIYAPGPPGPPSRPRRPR